MGRWVDGWMDGWLDGWMGGYRGILRGLLTQANPPCCFLIRGGLSPRHFTFVAHPENSWRRSPVNAELLQPLEVKTGVPNQVPSTASGHHQGCPARTRFPWTLPSRKARWPWPPVTSIRDQVPPHLYSVGVTSLYS